MAQTLQVIIKSAIFERERLLTIDKAYIEFDDKELISSPPVKFLRKDIVSFRHGIKWMQGFIAASIYCIDICNADHEVIEIRLKSIYGLRENEMAEKYSAILNALYEHFFDDISRHYLRQFEAGKEFSILDVRFGKQGIYPEGQTSLLPWKDIDVKVYYTYYVICSVSNAANTMIVASLTTWNAGILYSVLVQILKYQELLSKKNG